VVYAGKAPDEEALVGLASRYQPVAIIARYGRITERVMAASPRLRVVSKHGTGIDTIDVEAAKKRGIAVKAAAGANAAAVAEHTWALILACAKDVPLLDRRMHEGHWDKATHKSLELRGRTLGLVGLGAIGARTAAVGIAWACAWSPTIRMPAARRTVSSCCRWPRSSPAPTCCRCIAR
jgi:D-3-phosphoglycerate dehydrogenase